MQRSEMCVRAYMCVLYTMYRYVYMCRTSTRTQKCARVCLFFYLVKIKRDACGGCIESARAAYFWVSAVLLATMYDVPGTCVPFVKEDTR